MATAAGILQTDITENRMNVSVIRKYFNKFVVTVRKLSMATKSKVKLAKKEDFKTTIVDFFNSHNKETFNYKQVAVELGITGRSNQYMVVDVLDDLTFEGFLAELVPGKYRATEITAAAEGKFVRRSNGKNSVIVDGSEVPVFVHERNSMHALNGDRVRVHLSAQRRGFEPERCR